MLEADQRLNHLNCIPSLLLVKCRDVNAGHHFVYIALLIVNQKYFAVALAVVK